MKAMILAAGQGTRVRPITLTVPKPMIPILGKPVMEHIVEHLRDHGFDEIMVNTSHLAGSIENYFADGSRCGVDMAYSFEGTVTDGTVNGKAIGSAAGIQKVQQQSGFFDETFIVLCGDALIDADLTEAVEFHKKNGALATIVMMEVPKEDVSKYGVVQTDADGRILQFQEKPAIEDALSNMVNTGIYIFDPRIFDYIPESGEYDIGSELLPAIVAAGEPFYGFSNQFQWVDIGTAPDYLHASRMVLHGQVARFPIPGREVAPDVHIGMNVGLDLDMTPIQGPVFIGSSTVIESGAELRGTCSIGRGCRIESGAVVRDCVLGDYTVIKAGTIVQECIIFDGYKIEKDGQYSRVEDTDLYGLVGDARDPHLQGEEVGSNSFGVTAVVG